MTAPAIRPGIGAAAVTETLAERVEREQRALRTKSLASLGGVAVATVALCGIAAVLLLDDGRWMSLPRVVPLLVWVFAAAAVALLVRAGLRMQPVHGETVDVDPVQGGFVGVPQRAFAHLHVAGKGDGDLAAHGVQSKVGDSTPRILCSFGEVVVYCMWIFLSGKMYGAAPKAASAASWKPDRISFFLPG